jgi:hypothetical protein
VDGGEAWRAAGDGTSVKVAAGETADREAARACREAAKKEGQLAAAIQEGGPLGDLAPEHVMARREARAACLLSRTRGLE